MNGWIQSDKRFNKENIKKCNKDFRKWVSHEQLGKQLYNVLGVCYTTYVFLLWHVWRHDRSGHVLENRQQWKFLKSKNFDYFIQSYKKTYIQWRKIDQFRDDLTAFGVLKFRETMQFFLCFANFYQFWEIFSCWHFRKPTYVVLFFF